MEPIKNILVVDDEKMLLDAVASYLESKGFCVFTAETGAGALHILEHQNISFVILDLMLPDIPGEKICEKIRRESRIPVIMLTAKTEEEDILNGLRIGADDYITKPFQQAELLVRIRCRLRRSLHLVSPSPETLTVGGITLDDDARAVTVNDEPVSLTPLEYDILKFLMQHPCKVFSPQEIYRRVWREPPAAENSVAVHIRHIREKIEVDPSNPRYVTVVWGKGYKIEAGV